jgi:hypothetical protein
MDQSEKKLGGIQLRKFSELPVCQIWRYNNRFYISVWHYGSSFYVPEVHFICTCHSGGLIRTLGVPCCTSISTLFLLLVNKL